MNQLDYIHDLAKFMALWSRAKTGVQSLVNKSPDELLYFDPIDIATQKFFDLIQTPVSLRQRQPVFYLRQLHSPRTYSAAPGASTSRLPLIPIADTSPAVSICSTRRAVRL
jgi:hypothetical protein